MVLIQLGLGRLRRSQPGHGFAELGGSRRHGRPTSVVDTGIRAPNSELEPGTASSAAPGPAQHQVTAARWIAARKLPNRRRIVFSDGRMTASVQLSAVGSEPCSATNLRRAATDSAIRVSATSDSGTGSPSNTPGGFALWELRSTKFRIQLPQRWYPCWIFIRLYDSHLTVIAVENRNQGGL